MDPGHYYFLNEYSGDDPNETVDTEQPLRFMHRTGNRYPGNQGSQYDGTNCQEVIRAIINRTKYLREQAVALNDSSSVSMDDEIIELGRRMLWLFEVRAADIHGMPFPTETQADIETLPVCRTCGHIVCRHGSK